MNNKLIVVQEDLRYEKRYIDFCRSGQASTDVLAQGAEVFVGVTADKSLVINLTQEQGVVLTLGVGHRAVGTEQEE